MPTLDTAAPRRKALGDALRQIRITRGQTIDDVAKAAGIAPMTVRRLEDGATVRDRTHQALDAHLGVSPGTVKLALLDDTRMASLLARLGVEPVQVSQIGTPAGEQSTAEMAAAMIARVAGEDVAPTLRSRVVSGLADLLSALGTGTTASSVSHRPRQE